MSGSSILILYGGQDITSAVIFADCSFEAQMGGMPGTFSMRVRDTAQTHSFVTGIGIELQVDGVNIYAGYLTQVGRTYAFPAQSVGADPSLFRNRVWELRGVNLNVLFDKRVLRNPANYLQQIPNVPGEPWDGQMIRDYLPLYLDVANDDLDMITFVEDVYQFVGRPKGYPLMQQGSKWRDQINEFLTFSGALCYIDGERNLRYTAIDNTVKRWGFSDKPNNATITDSPISYQGSTIGPREIESVEDGSFFANDAFVWGGSSWTPTAGGTVFGRSTDATAIGEHNLWQLAETHFGEEGFGIQSGVDNRAFLITDGPPGAVGADQNRGLKYPQMQFKLAWFGHDVPILPATSGHDHIVPGELVTFTLWVFSEDGGTTPWTQLLPCRSTRISFPNLDPTGEPYVRFEGFFGLQVDDPYTLWRFLLKAQQQVSAVAGISTVDNSSTSAPYGAYGAFSPLPMPDGVTTVFTIPFMYISGTSQLFVNGLIQRNGIDYTESGPTTGTFTMTTAPHTGDAVYFTCRVAG